MSDNPDLIFHPISNPLNKMLVGQCANTNWEEAESIFTLNSLPDGNLPAMLTNCFTFFFTNACPSNFEFRSGPDCSRSARLVKKPVVIIVTLLSGCAANTLRYTSTASGTSALLLTLCA